MNENPYDVNRPNLTKSDSNPPAGAASGGVAVDGRDCAPRSSSGLWLIIIGVAILLGALGATVAQNLWGLALFLPLAWAVHRAWREHRASGSIEGSQWIIFGCLFPAAAGVAILTGLPIDYKYVVAVGFIAIGAMTMARRNRR